MSLFNQPLKQALRTSSRDFLGLDHPTYSQKALMVEWLLGCAVAFHVAEQNPTYSMIAIF